MNGSSVVTNDVERKDLQPARPAFFVKLAAPVASLVVSDSSARLHKRMLRNGDQDAAAGPSGELHLFDHGDIVVDMLDDVESADQIELIPVGNAPGIHLQELGAGCPSRRAAPLSPARCRSRFRPGRVGERLGDCFQGEPRPAADLSMRLAWEVVLDDPGDQSIPSAEPELRLWMASRKSCDSAGNPSFSCASFGRVRR